ncbi:hypothetical protein [Streptomyces sp. GbtcB6]|uniref:hypothetical protein n=1 Tax=Streptomyces sp. GbtcB6 TaxID=2824751 RepID=UPI001C2FD452|nr:hypothetical protein [Streptomyces sp. GbtcB6]
MDTIAAVLRSPRFRRPVLGQELRGAVVQGLGPGSSETRWTATVPQLAEAIDTALTRAEEKDTPVGSTTAGTGTADTPHALVISRTEHDFVGACQCGRAIGRTPRARPLDALVGLWEQHAAQADPDTAWADALQSLHTTPIGAS